MQQQQGQQQQQGSQAAAPVTKIVEALSNLMKSAQEEADKDSAGYKSFYDWCNGVFTAQKSSQDRYVSIQAELQSKLTVQQALNKQLKDEATQLEQETREAEQTIGQAGSMRQNEHSDYLLEQKNLASMLQVLNRAVEILSSSANKATLMSVTQSLQQIAAKSPLISDSQRDQLASFAQRAQQSSGDESDTISQTGSVVQVMKELIESF